MHMHIQIYTICTVASFVCGHLYLYVASFFGICAYTNFYMHIQVYAYTNAYTFLLKTNTLSSVNT